jgi:hypothetical protein
MMRVDRKSRTESTKDARTEREEDVKVTIIFATRRNIFAMKFMKIANFTSWAKVVNSASSSKGRR